MRSAPCLSIRRRRFCGCCRIGASCTWAARRRSRSTCALSRRPMWICARPCVRGKFREDLFYRLDVIRFDLPPLRSRREDIPALATHFLRRYSDENSLPMRSLSPEALRALIDYDWPGNVRELEKRDGARRGAECEPDGRPRPTAGAYYRALLLLQPARAQQGLFPV